jgi:hypothetical protein
MRTRARALWLGVCLLISGLVSPALAQEQRASVEGTVVDASGAVLPGATVEATATSGVLVSTTTDAAGFYRFLALPPGTYEVTATLTGFSTQKRANITVALGQILRVDLTLAPGGVQEQIQVAADAPLIDVKQSARAVNIRGEYIEKLPKGRDFSSLITQAPGANEEAKLGGFSIDGASAAENRFVIDGTETTNVQNGMSGKNLIVDFVDEVQVKSSGYAAEYGGATGGVVNVITRSGGNQLRGNAGLYFANDALQGAGRQTLRLNPLNSSQAQYITYPKDGFKQWEPGLTIGGPIVKDRVWFFGGYQPSITNTNRSVTLLKDQSNVSRDQKTTDHNGTANVTGQIGNKLHLRGGFNSSTKVQEGNLPALNGSDLPGTLYGINSRFPNYSYSATADYTASSKLFFSARIGRFFQDRHDENVPQGPLYRFQTTNIGMAGVPQNLQQAGGFNSVSTNSETVRDNLNRLDFQADATWFGAFMGQHALKGGVQVNRLGNDVLFHETGNRVDLFWDRSFGGERGTYGYYLVRSNGVDPKQGLMRTGKVSTNNVGLFVQDNWTLNNRVTVNAGLRSEKEDVPSFDQFKGISFPFANKLAPRLGLAWDLKGDGRTKVYASWGMFYDIMKFELPRGSFGGEHWWDYWYTLDSADWTNLVGSGCGPDCPGRLLLGPVDRRLPSNNPETPEEGEVDPTLKPMRSQEAVIGFERELASGISGTVRWVHKQLDVAIEDIGTLGPNQAEQFTIGNPGMGLASTFFARNSDLEIALPKAKRDYDGVEFAVDRRMSNNWALRASYLWSRLYGNYSGLSQSDENGRVSPNVGRGYDYPLMSFNQDGQPNYGVLATDRTHQVKVQFIYAFAFGTSVGLNQTASSGIPITREAAFIRGNAFPVQYLGRNSDGRTPALTRTSLLVQHELRRTGRYGVVLAMDVQNLFDQKTVINRNQTELFQGQAIDVPESQFYAGINTQQLIAQQNLVRNPLFLKDSAFQAARQIRLSVRFRF